MKLPKVMRISLLLGWWSTAWMLSDPFIQSAAARQPEPSAWESPLALFQTFISKADGQRCPMYPSCSSYAQQAAKKHGKLKGWLLAGDRLLRCGHDDTHRAPGVIIDGSRHSYDPLEANTFWWSRP